MDTKYVSNWLGILVAGAVACLLVIHGKEDLALTAIAMVAPGLVPTKPNPTITEVK